MQKIEYKTSNFDLKEFETLGSEWWIYTHCPKLEEKGRCLFYRPQTVTRKTPERKELVETPEFVKWYNAYPNKKARPMACKAWNKLKKEDQEKAISALGKHLWYWKFNKTPKNLIPHPATWLNNARWWDDLGEGVKTLEDLQNEEKRQEQIRQENIRKAEQEKKEKEEANEVTRIMMDLQAHSPERYKVIYDEALTHFTPEQQALQFFKPMLDARIRSIIHDKYVQSSKS